MISRTSGRQIDDAQLDLAKHADPRPYISLGPWKAVSGNSEFASSCLHCGGKDRVHVKLDSNGEWAGLCRQCMGINKWADSIGLVRHMLPGLGFADAVTMLAGAAQAVSGTAAPPAPPASLLKWDAADVATRLAAYQQAMAGSPGSEYLIGRGFCPDTWMVYGIGFDAGRQAIAIPWYRADRLVAVNYRRISAVGKSERFTAEKGGSLRDCLYGARTLEPDLHQLLPNGSDPLARHSLILIEGEFNCMSVWQAVHPLVDVLSMGSESKTLSPRIVAFAARYRCCTVWSDKEECAHKIANRIPGAAATWSEREGIERDANDLLQAGELRRCIAALPPCCARPHRQRGRRASTGTCTTQGCWISHRGPMAVGSRVLTPPDVEVEDALIELQGAFA